MHARGRQYFDARPCILGTLYAAKPILAAWAAAYFAAQSVPARLARFLPQSTLFRKVAGLARFLPQSTLWRKALCGTHFAGQSALRRKAPGGTKPEPRPEDPPIVSRFVSGLAGAPLVTRAAARAPPPRSSGRRTRTTSGARSDRAPLLGSGFVIRSEEGGARDEPLGRERSRERPAREERRREFRGPTTQSSREDS